MHNLIGIPGQYDIPHYSEKDSKNFFTAQEATQRHKKKSPKSLLPK